MDNSVQYLQSITFNRLSLQEKINIKLEGRPTPPLEISQRAPSSSSRGYTRHFNQHLYKTNLWLCGCSAKNALFCFPCLLFGGDTSWTKSGIKDLNHINRNIERHEKSQLHLNNMVNLSLLGTADIASQLDSGYRLSIARHNEKVKENRQILSKIIDCIKLCGKFELPLRGHNDPVDSRNPGVFRGLIDFACELDSSLNAHISSSSVFKGTSKTIQNELLESIMEVCKTIIKDQIIKADFLAVMCDETTDIYDKTQMVIVLRYVCEGRVVERFWGFFNPPNLTISQ